MRAESPDRRRLTRGIGAPSLLLLILLCVAVPAAAAGQELGVLRGTVRNEGQVPLVDVRVTIHNVETGMERDAVTNERGEFSAPALPGGTYRLTVDADEFAPYETEVELEPGGDRAVSITLAPAGPRHRAVFEPTPDRWELELPDWQRYPPTLEGTYPYVEGGPWDPYNQNILKGDRPVIGQDVFLVLTGTSLTPVDFPQFPKPAGVSHADPDSEQFFGDDGTIDIQENAMFSVELFKGDTAFRPKDWSIKVTPVFNLNYLNAREQNVVDISPAEGSTRTRTHVALQEAYAEVKLFDVGEHYDFTSVRAGIQPFISDFRGFLFRENNLGFRLFGNWGRNRNQWNAAVFELLEKDTNSALNTFHRRHQRVVVLNYYRQDFLTLGYTTTLSFHANLDDGDEFFFDENGFLVRPAAIGTVRPHEVRAYYVGWGGDGHIGRLNVSHQFYQAFGTDDFNGIAGREVDIDARFAVLEATIDKDWARPKLTLLYASGDDTPNDDTASGFDAIVDVPFIGGGPFSYWNRVGIRLTQTPVELMGKNSVLPALRSSKIEGQANFVNPGLLMAGLGLDAELTPKLRGSVHVNYLRFAHTQVLEQLLFQDDIDAEIGIDASVGFQWRPLLNDNIVILGGVSSLIPGGGFEDIYDDDVQIAPFALLTFTY